MENVSSIVQAAMQLAITDDADVFAKAQKQTRLDSTTAEQSATEGSVTHGESYVDDTLEALFGPEGEAMMKAMRSRMERLTDEVRAPGCHLPGAEPEVGGVFTDADLPPGDGLALIEGDEAAVSYEFSGERQVGIDYSNSGNGMVLDVDSPDLSTGTATGDTFQNVYGIQTTDGSDSVTLSQIAGGDGPSENHLATNLGTGSDYIVDGWGYDSIQLGNDQDQDIVVASTADDLPQGVYDLENSTSAEAAIGRPSWNDLYEFDFARDTLDLSALGVSGMDDPNLAISSSPDGWIEIRMMYDDASTRQIYYINTNDAAALEDPLGALDNSLIFSANDE